MLEKIGLPPKPSLRGNAWVVDASHCQSCSVAFTFINRKHHCRRCGGLFCNGCTQQRMLLRGQGDSPVRICDACKKLEEAARFEMRYGHKNRAGKGGSKLASEKEDDVLNQILGNEDLSSASSSKQMASSTVGDNIERSLSSDQSGNTSTHSEPLSPEDLRQQAVLEKQKYRTLKADGKSEEALRAFKRGKELERQAAALEMSLRKSRKKASSSSNFDDLQQVKDDLKASAEKIKLPSQKPKEDHDLSSQLKELGWSDADLRDAEKRPATLTLESELSSLLGEASQKPDDKKPTSNIGRSQVIAHKKKALELKRAGNVLEAKEELKKAKILERKIEEEELLGGSDDSDDELSSLMRSMDAEGKGRFSAANTLDDNFDISKFLGNGDDLGCNGALDVTDDDLANPDMISALKSLGWDEETMHSTESVAKVSPDKGYKPSPKSKLSIQRELIAIKKNVLTLRRQGKIDESEAELEKAKVLEQQLEDMNKAPVLAQQNKVTHATITSTPLGEEEDEAEVTDKDLQDPTFLSVLENLGWKDETNEDNSISASTKLNEKDSKILPPTSQEDAVSSYKSNTSFAPQSTIAAESVTYRKSKGEIQRELLTLKRKALALRRQGNTEEADEILENAKVLEAQLQEYEEAAQGKASIENDAVAASQLNNTKSSPSVELHGKGEQSKIKLDMPETIVHERYKSNVQEPDRSNVPETISSQATVSEHQPMSVQREILAHKRKALALKREGKLAEAKEELRLAKILEKREDTSQAPQSTNNSSEESVPKDPIMPEKKEASPNAVSKPKSSHDRFKLQQESLRHKRQALKLRREGKTEEADAEFELAKALETQLQELDGHDSVGSSSQSTFVAPSDVRVEDFLDPQLLAALQSVGIEDARSKSQPIVVESQPSSNKPKNAADNTESSKSEIKQLEEQIKGEKVKALNLKRAGKQAEALDSLRRAKLYEKKLQSLTSK